MNKKISCFSCGIISLTIVSCAPSDKDLTMKKNIISSFYSAIISSKIMGVPDNKERDSLSPYISKDLQSLLAKAWEAEKKYANRPSEPVPPLIEGALFVSLFEGADSCDSIIPDTRNGASFLVGFSSRGNGTEKDLVRWNDRVFVIRERGRWVIDDVELLGTWSFGRRGRVKDILRRVIQIAGEKND